jgi:3-oxoacyl-[acyl-carrier-protein] synthase-3
LKVKVTGVGLYLPPKIETAKDIASKIGRPVGWIIEKSGVSERRESEIDVDQMGAIAGKEALGDGGKPDLIISSDRGTIGQNFDEPESASLLGDGTAAVVLEQSLENESSELIYFDMKTFPSCANLTEVRGGGTNKHPQDPETSLADNLFTMVGPAVYKIARKEVYRMMLKTMKTTGLKREEVDWVIPHQASGKAVDAYISTSGFAKEKVVSIISEFGNCVAASVPMAFATAVQDGRIKRGDLLLFIGTGAGLSAACALFKY